MNHRVLLSLLLAGVSLGTPALAAPPTPHGPASPSAPVKPKDHADELFDQGTTAVDAGHMAEAEARFQQAWSLKQTHDIAGNLGIVKRHLGKHREAAEHLTWALDHMPPTESSATRKGLEQELKQARAEVGALRVRVSADGADVMVNGRAVGPSPIAAEVFVDVGSVRITARREGYAATEQSITVAKGEAREVSLVLAPVVVAKPRSVVPGVMLGSVAGAALVAGIGLFAGGRAKGSSARSENGAIVAAGHNCVSGALIHDATCADLYSTASTANTLQKAGVGVLVGAGAAALGTVLYFALPSSSAGAPSSGTLRLTPAVSPGSAGLVFSGTL